MDPRRRDAVGYQDFLTGLEVLQLRPPATGTAALSLFATCDSDKTGTISFAQIMAALEMDSFHHLALGGEGKLWFWDASTRARSPPHRARPAYRRETARGEEGDIVNIDTPATRIPSQVSSNTWATRRPYPLDIYEFGD